MHTTHHLPARPRRVAGLAIAVLLGFHAPADTFGGARIPPTQHAHEPFAIAASIGAIPFDTSLFESSRYYAPRSVNPGSIAVVDGGDDGDLDILVTGESGGQPHADIYESFVDSRGDRALGHDGSHPPLATGGGGHVEWEDFDLDNSAELLVPDPARVMEILHPRLDSYPEVVELGRLGLFPTYGGMSRWADFNRDGYPDVFLSGQAFEPGGPAASSIYYNVGTGEFLPALVDLPRLDGASAIADFDRDGDLDVFICGRNFQGMAEVYLLRNETTILADRFREVEAPLVPLDGIAAWGDLDADGWPDLAVGGSRASGGRLFVYRNDHSGSLLPPVVLAQGWSPNSISWGDVDHDGDQDLVVSEDPIGGGPGRTSVYLSDGTQLRRAVGHRLPRLNGVKSALADLDLDGHLDLIHIGVAPRRGHHSGVYLNSRPGSNLPPSAPGLPEAEETGRYVRIGWPAAADDVTPAEALSYNLRIGTSPGGFDVLSPMSDVATGFRKLVQPGNAGSRLSLEIWLPAGTYYCAAQAIDGAFQGGPFGPEAVFNVGHPEGRERRESTTTSQFSFGPAGANPSRPPVSFELSLPSTSPLKLDIFNLAGRLVATVRSGSLEAGHHQLAWDGRGSTGRRAPAGVYYARARVGESIAVQRFVLGPH